MNVEKANPFLLDDTIVPIFVLLYDYSVYFVRQILKKAIDQTVCERAVSLSVYHVFISNVFTNCYILYTKYTLGKSYLKTHRNVIIQSDQISDIARCKTKLTRVIK